MSVRWLVKLARVNLLLIIACASLVSTLHSCPAFAQEELSRKVKSKVTPVYPDMARKMSISGSVKVVVVVAPNGSVKSTKLVGGHPLLVNAAMDALKQWKFEPATEESTGTVEFKFKPE